jgi:hypothetical protein
MNGMQQQSRREFLITGAKAGLVTATLSAVGCGGGNNDSQNGGETIRTNFNGDLSGATTTPTPGAVFIGRASQFVVSWPFGDPPREFSIFLRRFLEPIGGESFDTPAQRIQVSQVSDKSWRVARRDNFDLDREAVYFLELIAVGGQRQRFVFITGATRATRDVLFTPNTGGNINDVDISPAPGSYDVARGVGGSGFALDWGNAFPAPNRFRVRLRRYKERRGTDNGGDFEQQTEGNDQGNGRFVVRRRNGTDLDGTAAYYLEVDATESGQGIVRAAFTTE